MWKTFDPYKLFVLQLHGYVVFLQKYSAQRTFSLPLCTDTNANRVLCKAYCEVLRLSNVTALTHRV
jgi:hypothetical protein